jgi:UDP-glucuronate decarboxylase
MRLEGKSIFLTGASGFIGRSLIDFISFLNENILSVPCKMLCVEHISEIKETDTLKTIKLNLVEPFPDISESWKFDYIMHAAGIVSPQDYSKWPLKTLELSYLGTKHVLEMANKQKVESILCFSSSAVYGSTGIMPICEESIGAISPFSDRSSYAVGKKVLETLSYFYHSKQELPVKIVRPFNIYGTRMGKNNVMIKFIDNILSGAPITIFGDGTQSRSFCHIEDAINGFLRVMILGKSGEAYNIGAPENSEISMFDLAKLLVKISGRCTDIKLVDYPEDYPKDEPRRSMPNVRKAEEEAGFYSSIILENGLRALYEAHKDKIFKGDNDEN